MRLNLKIISEEKTVPALITLFEEAIPSSLVQLGKHFRFVFDADARHFLELTRNMNYGKKKLLHPIFPRTITMGRLILIDLKPFPGPIKDIIRELLVKIHSALVYDTVVIIPKCKSIFVTYLSMHNSVTRFQQLSKLLEIFYEVLSLGIPLTYRAIYYRDQQLFQSSDKASSLVSSIAENFDVKETELNIYKTSSTLITGDVFVKHVPRPYVIGENFKEELEVKRNIPFVTILVLEKASVMYPVLSLLEKRKWINYLIISSRGYRDSHLIDYLSWLTQLSISFKLFVCTDPNIHGMNIYCDIKKVFKNCQRLLFSINELDARYRMMDGNSVAAQLGTNLLLKNKDLTNTEKEELKQLLVQRTKLELDQIPNIYYKIIAQMESLAPEVIDTI
ncbi:Spo11 [Candida maltosa Xu316]|uniref:Spo11 n=1 Tax=Candida maltosa (strain Xu316) TaxID=1245528 RepID=M3IJQ0_CANMX|nr:Spo11 [Candida maltosa Xu316]